MLPGKHKEEMCVLVSIFFIYLHILDGTELLDQESLIEVVEAGHSQGT